jgi:hypothetical protein
MLGVIFYEQRSMATEIGLLEVPITKWSKIVSLLQTCQSICIVLLICVFSSLAEGADISTLQTALSLVREDMEKTKSEHDAQVKAITEQQRIVAERKRQLADESSQLEKMQKNAKKTWEEYLEAQHRYEKAQANLDAAWGKK